MRESQVEKHLAKRVAALGGLCWGGDGLYAREGVVAGASCST